MNTYDNVTVSS